MKYKEEKDKYDLIFHRELSDKEFAEAMFEKWQDAVSDYDSLLENHDELQADYAKAIEQLRQPQISEKWIDMIQKIEAILAFPAMGHEIVVRITERDVRIDSHISGVGEEVSE